MGDGSTPVENSAFLVEGTRFVSVGRAGEIEAVDMWTHPIADEPADEELLALLRERPGLWYVPVLTPASRGGAG